MKNELNQHKRSDKIKWIITGVAFVLVFVLLAGVCLQVFGKGKIKPSEWFKKSETVQTQTAADNIVISPIESRGIELCSAAVPAAEYANYGIDPQAVENVFELSVTYTPANTTFQNTNYTIAFKNPNSAWATGKIVTDYAELQHESGSKNAVLTVKKSFLEQIIVKAISLRDNSKFATFTVDYLCTDIDIRLSSSRFVCNDNIDFIFERWTGGTLAPESNGHIYLAFNIWGASSLSQRCGFNVDNYVVCALNSDNLSDGAIFSIYDILLKAGHYYDLSSEEQTTYLNALGELYGDYADGETVIGCAFCWDRVYNGENYGGNYPAVFGEDNLDWTDIEGANFSEVFEVKATSLNPNNSHIVAV